jgi:restriction system protein
MNSNYRDPESPWNPRVPVNITPDAFELVVLDWLKTSAGQSGYRINAEHLGVAKGSGGDYKIDVLVMFTIFGGAQVTVLVECKHQRRPVEREDALILEAKLRDVGAHKGMLFSTSGFQKGAIEYAANKGIATVTVIAGKWLYETKAAIEEPVEPPPWVRLEEFVGVRVTPTDKGISSHTIDSEHTDALVEWLAIE